MNEIAPVLLIFFNRPDTLRIVFDKIKKVKPKKLYLAQDGPRNDNESDLINIMECRKIVENIDWNCQVYKKYEETNLGCGKGPAKAISWLFDNEEQGIVLEDDCIANESFFSFCTEMLEKYKEDERIFMITGCNLEVQSNYIDESYFFGYAGTNCGWASWRRIWKKMDYSCSWVSDKITVERIKNLIKCINKRASKKEIKIFKETNKLVNNNINISYWDAQFQSIRYLNHQLSIIPQKNLITNIGLGPTSTHAKFSKIPSKLYNKIGQIHTTYNEAYNLDIPLKHPMYVTENINYDCKIYNYLYPTLIKRIYYKFMSLLRKIFNFYK